MKGDRRTAMTRGPSFAPYVRLRLKAMSHFNISPMEWEKLSDQWKADLIAYERERDTELARFVKMLADNKKMDPGAAALLALAQW